MAGSKRSMWGVILLSAVLLVSGCFFDQLQRSEESDIQRVEQKQGTLETEQNQSQSLKQQEEQLATDLSERQLSLDELNDRVETINAENGRTIANNEAMRLQYHQLLAQLHETNEQLRLAQQGTDGSVEERRERIASLKAELDAQIDRLLR